MTLRVFATRLHGDGTETVVADEIPVSDPQVMRALSGFGGFDGLIAPEISALRDASGPLLVPGRTAIYAETEHGAVLGGGIMTRDSERDGAQFRLDCIGHAGYLDEMPYTEKFSQADVDPADMIRHAWATTQARLWHNLGVTVAPLTTPVRIGTAEEPFEWNYWSTLDLGREIDTLSLDTPIEYEMRHAWDDGVLLHHLALGYPRLGRRRDDLSFTVGVNVAIEPSVATEDDVSDIVVIGAGEGSAANRGQATRSPGGLGRTLTIVDKTLTTQEACNQRARRELDRRVGADDVSEIVVANHPNAPFASWSVGDDIHLVGSGDGWAGDLDIWVRVLSDVLHPLDGTAVLTVARA